MAFLFPPPRPSTDTDPDSDADPFGSLDDDCFTAELSTTFDAAEQESRLSRRRALRSLHDECVPATSHWCELTLNGCGGSLRWRETPDQQARAWECSLRLCHYLDRR